MLKETGFSSSRCLCTTCTICTASTSTTSIEKLCNVLQSVNMNLCSIHTHVHIHIHHSKLIWCVQFSQNKMEAEVAKILWTNDTELSICWPQQKGVETGNNMTVLSPECNWMF